MLKRFLVASTVIGALTLGAVPIAEAAPPAPAATDVNDLHTGSAVIDNVMWALMDLLGIPRSFPEG